MKLLRVLGERTIERVGGNKSIPVDVRVVAATNRNLKEMVERGEFREDLYFRLNVVHITMPPLRDRREDIMIMAAKFLAEFAEENQRSVKALSDEAREALLAYSWPGNVRELRTAMEHAVVLSGSEKILPGDLPEAVIGGAGLKLPDANPDESTSQAPSQSEESLNLQSMERRMIRRALIQTKQNRTEAASLLGISRRTLQRKLKEMESSNQGK